MRIVISSGHGKYIRGASGSPVPPMLDEVDEARKVVEKVASNLRALGVEVDTFHDNTSTDQSTNLNTIVNYHNAQTRDLDVSVHFNAYVQTDGPMGVEVLYVTQETLAEELSAAIADAGDLIDRGAKYRSDLFFLNNTEMPAVLIETAFCDSRADSDLYRENFDAICQEIAETLSGRDLIIDRPDRPDRPEPEPPPLTDENRVDIVGETSGDVTVVINGERIHGERRCLNVVSLTITMTGDVVVSLNGEDFHNEAKD